VLSRVAEIRRIVRHAVVLPEPYFFTFGG